MRIKLARRVGMDEMYINLSSNYGCPIIIFKTRGQHSFIEYCILIVPLSSLDSTVWMDASGLGTGCFLTALG